MEKEKINEQISRILQQWTGPNPDRRRIYLEALNLLRIFDVSGTFYNSLNGIANEPNPGIKSDTARSTLQAFRGALENGLMDERPLRLKIQGEIVSDFLEQAEILLNTKNIHPAAPAIIIGATLEEYLRNWCSKEVLEIIGKESIDTYAKALKEKEFINKQDMKDITSWAGLRNDAAHGNFDEVNDVKRVKLMLEGVNHFIREHSER